MARMKFEKRFDSKQFPTRTNGSIIWNDCIGKVFEFFYNDERHTFEIIEVFKDHYMKVMLDGSFIVDRVSSNYVRNADFKKYYYHTNYLYQVGDCVNNNLKIVSQTFVTRSGDNYCFREAAYECECMLDGYKWIVSEGSLKNGSGCPVCKKNKVVAGINDVYTLYPDLIVYFKNQDESIGLPKTSKRKLWFKCPMCGYEKYMRVHDLVASGFSCDLCADGQSYPNKFAHNLFEQLSDQYYLYIKEYSPNWANGLIYDNYFVLNDGTELIVEMDGHYHFKNNYRRTTNDEYKNQLAIDNGILLIRIKCNYPNIGNRFSYIKTNIIESLSFIFDLSYVDWELCDTTAISSNIILTILEYNKDRSISCEKLGKKLNMSPGTVRNYLLYGTEIGLCKYEQNRRKPVLVYDEINNSTVIFKSANDAEAVLKMPASLIRSYSNKNKRVKNYTFRYATIEEYEEFEELHKIS